MGLEAMLEDQIQQADLDSGVGHPIHNEWQERDNKLVNRFWEDSHLLPANLGQTFKGSLQYPRGGHSTEFGASTSNSSTADYLRPINESKAGTSGWGC